MYKEEIDTTAKISISGGGQSQSPPKCEADQVVVLNGNNVEKKKILRDGLLAAKPAAFSIQRMEGVLQTLKQGYPEAKVEQHHINLRLEVASALICKDVALWSIHATNSIAMYVGHALRGCVLMN